MKREVTEEEASHIFHDDHEDYNVVEEGEWIDGEPDCRLPRECDK